MKLAKRIGLVIVAALIVLVVFAGLQPDEYRVERSIVINAAPEAIFPLVGDIRNWEQWNPWKAKDPTVNTTYEGQTDAVGATSKWTSEKSGSGQMTFTEIMPLRSVGFRLIFIDFGSESDGSVSIDPAEAGQRVTWVMSGKHSFVEKIFWIFFQSALEKDFDQGLELLKSKVPAA